MWRRADLARSCLHRNTLRLWRFGPGPVSGRRCQTLRPRRCSIQSPPSLCTRWLARPALGTLVCRSGHSFLYRQKDFLVNIQIKKSIITFTSVITNSDNSLIKHEWHDSEHHDKIYILLISVIKIFQTNIIIRCCNKIQY